MSPGLACWGELSPVEKGMGTREDKDVGKIGVYCSHDY